MIDDQHPKPKPRRLSVLAGLVAIIVGSVRFLRGQEVIDRMADAMGHPAEAAMLLANWHGLTAIIFILGAALIASAWSGRGAARWVGFVAAAIFGTLSIFIGAFATAALGNPFALYPVFALALLAGLSLVAAVQDRGD